MSSFVASRDAFLPGARFSSRAAMQRALAELVRLSDDCHPLGISYDDRSQKSRSANIMCSKHGSHCVYARVTNQLGDAAWFALSALVLADWHRMIGTSRMANLRAAGQPSAASKSPAKRRRLNSGGADTAAVDAEDDAEGDESEAGDEKDVKLEVVRLSGDTISSGGRA